MPRVVEAEIQKLKMGDCVGSEKKKKLYLEVSNQNIWHLKTRYILAFFLPQLFHFRSIMLKFKCWKSVHLCLHEAVAVRCGNLVWILWVLLWGNITMATELSQNKLVLDCLEVKNCLGLTFLFDTCSTALTCTRAHAQLSELQWAAVC